MPPQPADLLARDHVPEPDGPVLSSHRQEPARRGEAGTRGTGERSGDRSRHRPRRQLPQHKIQWLPVARWRILATLLLLLLSPAAGFQVLPELPVLIGLTVQEEE